MTWEGTSRLRLDLSGFKPPRGVPTRRRAGARLRPPFEKVLFTVLFRSGQRAAVPRLGAAPRRRRDDLARRRRHTSPVRDLILILMGPRLIARELGWLSVEQLLLFTRNLRIAARERGRARVSKRLPTGTYFFCCLRVERRCCLLYPIDRLHARPLGSFLIQGESPSKKTEQGLMPASG